MFWEENMRERVDKLNYDFDNLWVEMQSMKLEGTGGVVG